MAPNPNPTVDVALMWKTLDHVEAHPEELNQEAWRCGSTMCFAGHAATIAGGQWYATADDPTAIDGGPVSAYMLAEPDDDLQHVDDFDGIGLVLVEYRARRVLGLTRDQAVDLFAAANDLDDLRQLVVAFTGERR